MTPPSSKNSITTSAAASGAKINVFNAPTATSSTRTAYAVRFRKPASSSTLSKASANAAMRATQSAMANVLVSTELQLTASVALSGKTVFAPSALRDGTLALLESAPPSAISAQHGTPKVEPARLATTDLSLSMETVLLSMTLASFLRVIYFARVGLRRPASSALKELTSTRTESVLQSVLSAAHSTEPQDFALLVSLDTTMSKEIVFSHLQILLLLQT